MRICVCGGRLYTNREYLYGVLYAALFIYPKMTLISGGAMGADTLAKDWAEETGIPKEIYYASWGKFGNAAGPIRNKKMIETGIDLLIAFPGGKGTANMIEQCKKANIDVFDLRTVSK